MLALEREEAQASGLGVHGIHRVREQPDREQVRELARTVALAAERADEPAVPVVGTDLLVLPLRHVDVALRADREPAHARERGLRVVRAADAELLDERPPLPRSVFGRTMGVACSAARGRGEREERGGGAVPGSVHRRSVLGEMSDAESDSTGPVTLASSPTTAAGHRASRARVIARGTR